MRSSLPEAARLFAKHYKEFGLNKLFIDNVCQFAQSCLDDPENMDEVSWARVSSFLTTNLGDEWRDFEKDLSWFTWGPDEDIEEPFHKGDVKTMLLLILNPIDVVNLEDFL